MEESREGRGWLDHVARATALFSVGLAGSSPMRLLSRPVTRQRSLAPPTARLPHSVHYKVSQCSLYMVFRFLPRPWPSFLTWTFTSLLAATLVLQACRLVIQPSLVFF